MTKAEPEVTVREGDVIYFHDLHLETARRVSQAPIYQNIHRFEVEGKSRPVIIIDELETTGNRGGTKWLRVLRLSTKISDVKKKLGYIAIGPILDRDKVSYADSTPQRLPSNLIDGSVKKHIDRLDFGNIMRIVTNEVLRRPRQNDQLR